MFKDTLILSENHYFIKGIEEIVKDISIRELHKRRVFIDVSFDGMTSDYTPLEGDSVFYITPHPYSSSLKNLFIAFIHHGNFISVGCNINQFKESLIKDKDVSPSLFRHEKLTPMELEVLKTFMDLGTYTLCTKKLNISRKTVSHHKINAMEKLGIKSLPHLIILFKKLISPVSR